MTRLLAATGAILCLLSVTVHSEPTGAANTTNLPSPSPTLGYSVESEVDYESIASKGAIVVTIRNLQPNRDLILTNLSVSLPMALESVAKPEGLGEERRIPKGQVVQLRCPIAPAENVRFSVPYIFFQCRERQAVLEIQSTLGADSQSQTSFQRVPLNPRASMACITAGCIVGVLTITLFRLSYAFAFPDQAKTAVDRAFMHGLLARFAFGVIVCFLAVAFLNAGTTALGAFPIAIRASDFMGGLVVGLFCETVGHWLARGLGVAA